MFSTTLTSTLGGLLLCVRVVPRSIVAKLIGLAGILLLASHINVAQAAPPAACTAFTVFNHTSYSAYRTLGQSGSCTLPSGIVMSWRHVGANRQIAGGGCSSYEPTYWMDSGTITVTFSQPVNDVGFVLYGLDGNDAAAVNVGTSTTAAPQTFSKEFTDLCPGRTSTSPPTVVGNVVQGTGGAYYGQIGVRATDATPYTNLVLAITGGSGFGIVGIASPSAIAPAVPAPTVTSVSPASGSTAGGGVITITGTNLTGATGVTVGGASCTNVTVVDATTITCSTPAGTAGTASVLVTTAGGTNAANTLFTYITPAPESIPTLGEWMMILMAGLMVMFGYIRLRGRRT